MNTAEFVAEKIAEMKAGGVPLSEAAWETAKMCVGWPYVFGAWGAECTVAERKKRYRESHPTIRSKCKAFDGGSCAGCQWFPDGKRVRCYDCRGFTDWVLKTVGIIDLQGEGATSQWNTAANWQMKGTVAEGIPQGVIVCLFYTEKTNPSKMAHTGLYYCGETVECSSGVQYSKTLAKKWTHWAVPRGVEGGTKPAPAPAQDPDPVPAGRPKIQRGSKGAAVIECQTMLDRLGYDLGSCGIDGDFGSMTRLALITFQRDHNLATDGICGPATWAALEKAAASMQPTKEVRYAVNVPNLTEQQADELVRQYPGATRTIEKGR